MFLSSIFLQGYLFVDSSMEVKNIGADIYRMETFLDCQDGTIQKIKGGENGRRLLFQ